MTVPFRPTVDVEPNSFLDTLSRTFLQTRNLVEDDRRRKRAAERFETEQQLAGLRSTELSNRIGMQEASTERQARSSSTRPTSRGTSSDSSSAP